MPEIEPDNGEVERHMAYTRLNPSGDKELVVGDDEETLNELAISLQECAEEYIWKCVQKMLPERLQDDPKISDRINDAIGRGATPEEIVAMFESISFGGVGPSGGGMGSPEQPPNDRRHNQPDPPIMVSMDGDRERAANDDLNNFTSTTRQVADGPEQQRAKSKYGANARGNDLPIKNIAGYRGDGLDYGATHSESFTGTGAIAIPPAGGFTAVSDDEEDEDEDEDDLNDTDSESVMTQANTLTEEVNQVIKEWEPSFASGEYQPGEYQMPSAPGDGVADRKPTQDKVGAYDTDTSQDGKEWPRDHNDTEAMGKVENDGTDHKPAGTHESSVAEPTDGHQDKVGHNWPDEAKNSGSGVAEPFEGDRWSDGGVLKTTGQDEMDNDGADQTMPSEGPITGTSGPQMGQMEAWDPRNIGTLMEGDLNLQDLFNNYAADHGRTVCLEDFQALCNAHGCEALLDERSLMQLMEANQQFIFYQGEDANGYYWQPTPIAEGATGAVGGAVAGGAVGGIPGAIAGGAGGSIAQDTIDNVTDGDDDDDLTESKSCGECGCDPCECDDEDCMAEGENRRPFGQTISELQIRSPEAEARPYGGEGPGNRRPMGDPDFGNDPFGDVTDDLGGHGGLETGPDDYNEMLGGEALDAEYGPGQFGDADASTDSCPECGEMTTPGEEMCPGCGAPVGGGDPMDELGAPMGAGARGGARGAGAGAAPAPAAGGMGGMPYETTLVNSPAIMEGLNGFMSSARRILEHNHDFHREHIAEALNLSWVYHARHVDPGKAPQKVQQTIQGLMRNFPGFRPVTEGGGDAMKGSDGTAIGTGGASNSSDFLAAKDQPGPDLKDEGEPLGKSQKNTYKETPVISGTHKGMDGKGSVAQSVKESVARLSKHVQKALREGARKSLRGKYGVGFSLIVTEGEQRNRTAIRTRLAEALADAEELLQLHDADDVTLEATFTDKSGTIALKQDIPLFTIKPRGLMVSEGMAIFRFKRTAENFANELVAEGATCRVMIHNWGRAVATRVPLTLAETVFRTLVEKKKWMQDVESTGECTPMSKPSCTGRKKAFAKRVQKGGDLYSGKKD